MAEFASKGVAGAGLGTGIAGLTLGVLNGGLGNLLGGGCGTGWNNNCGCSENHVVNRYELGQESRISKLESEIALRDANIYNDQKLLDLYKYFDAKVEEVKAALANQAVYNASQTNRINCMDDKVTQLFGLTKTIVPITNVCPQPMPQYNSWTAPTTTTTTP